MAATVLKLLSMRKLSEFFSALVVFIFDSIIFLKSPVLSFAGADLETIATLSTACAVLRCVRLIIELLEEGNDQDRFIRPIAVFDEISKGSAI